MAKIAVIVKLITLLMGLDPSGWACWLGVPTYVPKERWSYACEYAFDQATERYGVTVTSVTVGLTWDGVTEVIVK